MNVIDIIILLCCVPALYNGITKGFISQAFSLVALVLGAWFSFKFAGPLGEWLKSYADLPGPILNVIAFALILVIVVLVLKMTAMTFERLLKVVMLGWLDKLLGVVFALIKAVLIIGLVIVLLDSVLNLIPFISSDTLNESILYHPIKDIANIIFPYLKELIFNK